MTVRERKVPPVWTRTMQLQAGKGGLGCETNKSPRLVTFVPLSYSTGPFPIPCEQRQTSNGNKQMPAESNKRRGSRIKAVLPVRIKGKDNTGKTFEELAHTL